VAAVPPPADFGMMGRIPSDVRGGLLELFYGARRPLLPCCAPLRQPSQRRGTRLRRSAAEGGPRPAGSQLGVRSGTISY